VYAHEFDRFHSTRLSGLVGCLEKHGIASVHGMVELYILAQIFLFVLQEWGELSYVEVPFPSSADTHLLDAPLYSILYTKLEVIMVWVDLIPGSSS
jgi:hypothetical protein